MITDKEQLSILQQIINMKELGNKSNLDFTTYTNSEENTKNNNDWKQSAIKHILKLNLFFIIQIVKHRWYNKLRKL